MMYRRSVQINSNLIKLENQLMHFVCLNVLNYAIFLHDFKYFRGMKIAVEEKTCLSIYN